MSLREFPRNLLVVCLSAMFAIPPSLLAEVRIPSNTPRQPETHVVSPLDLHNAVVDATQARQKNMQKVQEFLSSEVAVQTMKSAHINPVQVKAGIASLSDQELAQLAARADKAQQDFAAGAIGHRELAIIILGVLVVILIVVLAA
ncbi:MAG TPA: PA2779 family protein [Terriglobales bacterium]|nr:PA2779 family protein [Terriglobales bacterium]